MSFRGSSSYSAGASLLLVNHEKLVVGILQRGQVFVLPRVPSVAFGGGRRRGDEHLVLCRAVMRRVIVRPPQAAFLRQARWLVRTIVDRRV